LRARADPARVPGSILIVGGGLAAQRAAETLRARDHHGPIRVVCGEPEPPYDRPPLSKELTAAPFRPPDWYADHDVELLLGRRAARLDVFGRRVLLEDGEALAYDELIIATGARARRLPFMVGRPNVHVLRTLADARGLRSALGPGVRLAIVGAGFVGQELAATARGLGADVTMIEAGEVPLARVLGPRLGGWFAGLHREEGVRLEVGAALADALPAVAGAPVSELVLADGRRIAADVVLVAIGVVPETRWLKGSPLADGVTIDEGARTVIPHVYAAGDVVRGCGHWEPAARLGTAAARSILGMAAAPAPPESFWSDQYGVRIHLVGEAAGADAVELDGDGRNFTAVLRRRGALIGALLVGRPRELPHWRRQLATAQLPERSAA
jgi:NADPH-dependent 2,4-dienoyl-CoA reductase/sulfur reductase-like enzyme